MESTPSLQGSKKSHDDPTSFTVFRRGFESTPKPVVESTPLSINPRKRKITQLEMKTRQASGIFESCTSTPKYRGTLNDSLTRNFEGIHIETSNTSNFFQLNDCDEFEPDYEQPLKRFKDNGNESRVIPEPSTPEHHSCDTTPRKASSSFLKSFSNVNVHSPFKEKHDILYPELKPLEPARKPLTPQKLREKIETSAVPAKKCLFGGEGDRNVFLHVVTNQVVMPNIFKYLSSGDLFRVSMVCKALRVSLEQDRSAYNRYLSYRANHKEQKENYKITPPNSPEKGSSEEQEYFTGSGSPSSKNFKQFINLGRSLKENQSLIKCHQCGKPSVVEKTVAQCMDPLRCGYIVCLKCNSFAYKHEDFLDLCQTSSLLTQTRKRLEDLSNNSHSASSFDINESSIFSSTFNNNSTYTYDKHYISSGYYSGLDSPVTFKRDLAKSFVGNESIAKPVVLQESNKPSLYYAQRRRSSGIGLNESSGLGGESSLTVPSPLVPVIENVVRKKIEIIEPSSPPKIKPHAVGSKQSKKNLKRLTR